MLAGVPRAIPGWDDRDQTIVPFLRVCLLTWCEPVGFARQFPWTCSRRSANLFLWLTRLAALGVYVATWLVVAAAWGADILPKLAKPLILVAVAVPVGATACEALVSLMLRLTVRPRFPSSWWGFVRFHGSFLILSAAISGSMFNVWLATDAASGVQVGLQAAVVINLGWWWYCLARGVLVRGEPGIGRLVAVMLIPFVAVAAIGPALLVGGCCALTVAVLTR